MLRNEPNNSPAVFSSIKKVFSGGVGTAKTEQQHSGSGGKALSLPKKGGGVGLAVLINIFFFIVNLLIFTVLVVSARSQGGGGPHQPVGINIEGTVGGGGGVLGAEEGQHASPSSGAQLTNCLALVRRLQQARRHDHHHLPLLNDIPANDDDKNNRDLHRKNKEEGEEERRIREEQQKDVKEGGHVRGGGDSAGRRGRSNDEVSSSYGSLIPPPTNNVLAVAAARNKKEQQQQQQKQNDQSPLEGEEVEKDSGGGSNGSRDRRSPYSLATMSNRGVEQQQQLPYLIIGMPSAPRPKELWRGEEGGGVNNNVRETILYRTLRSISVEMEESELLRRLVKVVVMNARPAGHRSPTTAEGSDPSHPHRTFEAVKDAFVGAPHSSSSAVYISTELLSSTSGNKNITDDGFFSFSHSKVTDETGVGSTLGLSSSKKRNAAKQPWLYFIDKPSPLQENRLGFSFPSPGRPYLANPLRDADSTADDQEFGHKQQEMPTESVRRQTNDVIALLDLIKGKSSYFYFSEDDMSFCGNTVTTILYMIEKARRTLTDSCMGTIGARGERSIKRRGGANINGDGGVSEEGDGGPFAAIRCGFGLNGIIMHNGGPNPTSSFFTPNINEAMNSNALTMTSITSTTSSSRYPDDVAAFADYLYRYQFRRPPDHLATEFFAQESQLARAHYEKPTYVDFCTADEPPESVKHHDYQQKKNEKKKKLNKRSRRVAAFRYNVVQHLGGSTSTLRDEEAWAMPECFAELTEPQVFAVEAWNPNECGHTDLWPCPSRRRGEGGGHNGAAGGGDGGFGKIQMRVPAP